MQTSRIMSTESLGFNLVVNIIIDDDLENFGQYVSEEDANTYLVHKDSPHTISIKSKLDNPVMIIAHECYHLFYAIRHLIAWDEETETEVFGELCQEVYNVYEEHQETT